MLYSLKRIFHNIKRNIGVYLIFILEFIVGITIFVGTLNVTLAINDDLNNAKKELENQKIRIVFSRFASSDGSGNSWQEASIHTYKQYLDVTEKYKDSLSVLYINSFMELYSAKLNGGDSDWESLSRWCCFINDEMYEEMFNSHMEPGKIYAGTDAYEKLQKQMEYSMNPEYTVDSWYFPPAISIKDGEFCISGNKTYKLEKLPECGEELIPHSWDLPPDNIDPGTAIAECVFIPIEEYPAYADYVDSKGDFTEEDVPIFRGHLSVKYKNPDVKGNVIPDLLEFMTENSGYKFEFKVDNTYMQIMKLVKAIQGSLIEQTVISVSVLLIVFFGTTGHFIIYFYRRKQQMAVSIAYGSTKNRLFLETLTEILLITVTGATCGIMLMHKLMPYAVKTYASTEFRIESVIIAILIAVVTSVLSTLLSFTGIKEISPANILKDL